MAEPVYNFGIEFVTGSFTDVTTRLERGSWGSAIVDMFRPPKAGDGMFELSNDDGQFTARNNSNLKPGRAVRLKAYAREIRLVDYDFTQETLIPQRGSLFSVMSLSRSTIAARWAAVDKHFLFSGVFDNYIYTTSSAVNAIRGDIDIRVKCALADWTPNAGGDAVLKKWGDGFALAVESNGRLSLWIALKSGNIFPQSTVATSFTDGSVNWIRATRVAATGVVRFYTSSDGTSWTQLGADVTDTAGEINNLPGQLNIITSGNWTAAEVYYAEVRNGINGTVALKFNPAAWAPGQLSHVSETGELWQIVGTPRLVCTELEQVSANQPRFDYNPVTGARRGLRIDPAATNRIMNSAVGSVNLVTNQPTVGSGWSLSQNNSGTITTSVFPNVMFAPDGTVTMCKVVEGNGYNEHGHGIRQAITVPTSGLYAISFFASAAERTRVSMWGFGAISDTTPVIFDVLSGTVVQGSQSSMEHVGGGIYRCWRLYTMPNSTAYVHIGPQDSTLDGVRSGDGSSGVFVWGGQFEADLISAYMPTSLATFTRGADVYEDTDISQWYDSSKGTLYVEGESAALTAGTRYIATFSGSNSSRLGVVQVSSLNVEGFVVNANSFHFQAAYSPGVVNPFVLVMAWRADSLTYASSGQALYTDTSVVLPTVNRFCIGHYDQSGTFCGWVKRAIYAPSRPSNAEAAILSRGHLGLLTEERLGVRDLYFGGVAALGGPADHTDHAYRLQHIVGAAANEITLELDFKPTSIYDWSDWYRHTESVSGYGGGLSIYGNANALPILSYVVDGTGYSAFPSSGSVQISKRFLIHGTLNNSLMSLYINGTCVATAACPNRYLSNVGSHPAGFQAGATYYGLKAWNRALSPDDINDLWLGKSIPHGLFMDLNFRKSAANSGDILEDRSGNGNHLTLVNSFSWSATGSEYPLFFGRIQEVSHTSALGMRTTILQCADDWDRVGRLTYTTSLFLNKSVASLFTELMSLSTVNSFAVDSQIDDDTGFAWYRDRSATNALHEIVQSGNYQLVVDGNGTYRLRNRYWNMFASSVGTYGFGETWRIRYSQDTVINRMKLNSDPRRQDTNISTLAYIVDDLTIPASGAIGFWITYQDPDEISQSLPVTSVVALVASTDYYATDASTPFADRTSTLSVRFTSFAATAVATVFNAHSAEVLLTRFQVRGYPVRRVPSIGVQAENSSSQNLYGVKDFVVENALVQDRDFMDGIAKTVVAGKKEGLEENNIIMINEFPDVLKFNPGEVVSVVDSFSGYVTQWRVRSTEHELELANGVMHRVTLDTENFDELPFLVLDHTSFGKLNDGRVLGI